MLNGSSMSNMSSKIVIVGAGLAGMSAAAELIKHNKNVLVIEKAKDIGGRLAGTQIRNALFDKGAQFMTARDERFKKQIDNWVKRGLAKEWYRTLNDETENHPRWRGSPDMRALVRDLSIGVDVVTKARVSKLSHTRRYLEIELESGESIAAETVILTAPVPQCLEILKASSLNLSVETREQLEIITYEPCLALMAILDSPSKIPEPGALKLKHEVIDWISDNHKKGISAVPSVTIHASSNFSSRFFTKRSSVFERELLEIAKPWLGAPVVEHKIHAWRYSKPRVIHEETFLLINKSPTLIIAGDAFSGPRVEGAVISGLEAAQFILNN